MVRNLIIATLLMLGLIARLYKINQPIADWHSHRQSDTASVTDIFFKRGVDLLYPKYQDLSNLQSGLDNPDGIRFVEFPIYNYISFLFAKALPFDHVTSYRLTSITISIISSYLVFLITNKYSKSFFASTAAMSIFLFLPFNIFYSRSILPDVLSVALMLATIYFFDTRILLSATFFSLGLLVKPFIGFVIFPLILYLTVSSKTSFYRRKTTLIIFCLIALIPFITWRVHVSSHPEAVPYSKWLFNIQKQYLGPHNWSPDQKINPITAMISFKPYWFRWLFYERIGNLILGIYGIIPLFLGLAYRFQRLQNVTFSLFMGIIFYFIVIAGGNIQHDYYQILIIPSISIISGIGFLYIYKLLFTKAISSLAVITIFGFTIVFSGYKVKDYYNVNNWNIVEAGSELDRITPPEALVIAPYNGDTAFLYQTKRSGWPIEIYDFQNIQDQHPSQPIYFTSVNFDDYTNRLIKEYPIVIKNDHFVILKIYEPQT